jgi:hypothetical protein
MDQKLFVDTVLPAGLALLPPRFTSDSAKLMIVAIMLQESGLRHRRQQPAGPARSYAQFELPGVNEVMQGPTTRDRAAEVLSALDYAGLTPSQVHAALEHNDLLAVCFTRLLLWGDPAPLPSPADDAGGWQYYLRRWRPGKPRPEKWPTNWATARALLGL